VDPRSTVRGLCLGAMLLISFAAHGQSGTQAVLTGQVVDQDGKPMPGVTITAHSPSSAMAPAGTVTDDRGRYRFNALRPGNDYAVVAELPGYAKVEIGPIDLNPGKTTTQNISLFPATETTTTVQVTAQGDIVDVASTKTATVFNTEFIEGLPLLGRSYQDVLTLAPGVTDTDGDGNPNVNGARETDFQTRVDGANTTDPFTGTFGQNLNLESIAEIEIITTGASAEFSQAQGGFANIITKSGGNDFEGSFKFFFRSSLLDNDGSNNNDITNTDLFAELDGFQDVRPFLTVGGPIVKNHLWYFVAIEYINLETPVNTLTSPVLATEQGWQNFAKLSWQINAQNRLSFQVNSDPRRFTGVGLDTGVAPESDVIFDQGGLTSTLRWTSNLSPMVLFEGLVARFDTGIDLLPVTDPDPCFTGGGDVCNPFSEDLYTIDIRSGITRGPFNLTSRDSRNRDTLRSDLSIFLEAAGGSHNIKTGFEFARESFQNQQQANRIRFDDFGASGGLSGGDRFEGSINFQESVPSSQFREAEKNNLGLYVQDSYKPRPNLTINVGLRLDREEATTEGFESFDPSEQADAFLDLYAVGAGTPRDDLVLFPNQLQDDSQTAVFGNPGDVVFDINGDGLDFYHCSPFDADGDTLGDGEPDGAVDDFWTYVDGDFDGILDPDNPVDFIIQVPDGQPDGTYNNPICDKKSDDTFALVSVFNRHQFDDTAEPFASLLTLDVSRGLPGLQRQGEEFTIINNNVAPRLSVSWDPWANNKTKFFATWSRFYGTLFLGTLVPELGPDPRTEVYDANSQNAGVSAVPLQRGRFSITQVDRDIKTPFTDELTFGFERELAPEWSIGFTFVKRMGRDQLQDVDLNPFVMDLDGEGNFDDDFGRVSSVQGNSDDNQSGLAFVQFADTPDGQPDLFAYNPYFNQVLRVGNFNSSEFISYQFVVTRRLSRQWQMTGSYVYSQAVGDAESFLSNLGNDPGTVADEFGPLSFDQTHRLVFSGVTSRRLGGVGVRPAVLGHPAGAVRRFVRVILLPHDVPDRAAQRPAERGGLAGEPQLPEELRLGQDQRRRGSPGGEPPELGRPEDLLHGRGPLPRRQRHPPLRPPLAAELRGPLLEAGA